MSGSDERALVLTVGTGDLNKIEETLLAPLLKSFRAGQWSEAVLLPSRVTESWADELRSRLSEEAARIRIEPLPRAGMENDADACFGHFDTVLAELVSRFGAEFVMVDFTRGTKAMSAALVLAAVGRRIPKLRYITGPRDDRGMVRPSQEEIRELVTTLATGRRLLADARTLMRHGDFAAAVEILPDPEDEWFELRIPPALADESRSLYRRAAFLAAWDRLDYGVAADRAGDLAEEDRERVRWVRRLADRPEDKDHAKMARWLRSVACDLLENGRRRIRDRHFEDALVRGYRVRELIVQFLLFDRGVNTGSIPPELEQVKSLQNRLKPKEQKFGENRRGTLTAGRELATRLLKEFDEKLGKRVLNFDQTNSGKVLGKRNHSVLVHGFKPQAPPEADQLEQVFRDLESLLCDVDGKAPAGIEKARQVADIQESCRPSM